MVAYTFLYWLPYYIDSVTIASTELSPQVGFVVLVAWIFNPYLVCFSGSLFLLLVPVPGCWQPVSVV